MAGLSSPIILVFCVVFSQAALRAHFFVTLRVEWPAGASLLHCADLAGLEDAWTDDCYGQHKHEWRTTCCRDPGPTLNKQQLAQVITRNKDLVSECVCVSSL